MRKVNIKYRTFDELLNSVQLNLPLQSLNNQINPASLIGIVKAINKELQINLLDTTEAVIDIHNGKGKLPSNFEVMNFALCSFEKCEKVLIPKGLSVEEYVETGCFEPGKYARYTECGDGVKVVVTNTIQGYQYTFKHNENINFIDSSYIRTDCPNNACRSKNTAYIKNGWVYTNFKEGNLYINYNKSLEDEDGNLLVIDDDIINLYYENALTVKILKDLLYMRQPVGELYQLAEKDRRNSRIEARARRFTTGFYDLSNYWKKDREAMRARFVNMFK